MTSVPEFMANSLSGNRVSRTTLIDLGGVAFFFCGCEPCHVTARAWRSQQRIGLIQTTATGKHISPLIVFMGDNREASHFLVETGLNEVDTVVIPDPMHTVSSQFRVISCPRVFVVRSDSRIGYTNTSVDDSPEKANVPLILQRTSSALQLSNIDPGRPATSKTAPNSLPFVKKSPLKAAVSPNQFLTSKSEISIDLGKIERLSSSPVVARCLVRNTGSSTVTLERLQGSCGCTNVRMIAGDAVSQYVTVPASASNTPISLVPGAVLTVFAELNPQQLQLGKFVKYVWGYMEGSQQAAITMNINGQAIGGLPATSRRIDFGHVKSGDTPATTVRFDLSEKQLTSGSKLMSTSRDFIVTHHGGTRTRFVGGEAVVEVEVEVRVSPEAPSGILEGDIILAKSGTRLASVSADKQGDIECSPRSLIFGAIRAGESGVRSCTLTGMPIGLRSGQITVISADVWLKCRIQSPESGRRRLDVEIDPSAPVGALHSTILVRAEGIRSIRIHVTAEVLRK